MFLFVGSPFIPPVPALPVEERRQIRLVSHLQPLRYASRSHPAFQPWTQADSWGPPGSRRLPGYGLPASFRTLFGPFCLPPDAFGARPVGLRVQRAGSTIRPWAAACPSMQGLIPRWQDSEALRRCARLDPCGDVPLTTPAIGRRIGPHHNQPPRQVDL